MIDLEQKPMLVLVAGYWGSNMETLGAVEYRGYHVCVDDGDMGMPEDGGPFRIGIYADQEAVDDMLAWHDSDSGFGIEKMESIVNGLIDSIKV